MMPTRREQRLGTRQIIQRHKVVSIIYSDALARRIYLDLRRYRIPDVKSFDCAYSLLPSHVPDDDAISVHANHRPPIGRDGDAAGSAYLVVSGPLFDLLQLRDVPKRNPAEPLRITHRDVFRGLAHADGE